MLLYVVVHPCSLTGRNRCCVETMLSWRLWDNLGLIDVTPSRLLREDNPEHGRHGEVSYRLPLQSRCLELSKSFTVYKGSLSAVMPCLGWFLETFWAIWMPQVWKHNSVICLVMWWHSSQARNFISLGGEEPFVWWIYFAIASLLSEVAPEVWFCEANDKYPILPSW